LSKVPKAGFSIIDGQSATWEFVSIASSCAVRGTKSLIGTMTESRPQWMM
jgi:hypothetical protein